MGEVVVLDLSGPGDLAAITPPGVGGVRHAAARDCPGQPGRQAALRQPAPVKEQPLQQADQTRQQYVQYSHRTPRPPSYANHQRRK